MELTFGTAVHGCSVCVSAANIVACLGIACEIAVPVFHILVCLDVVAYWAECASTIVVSSES